MEAAIFTGLLVKITMIMIAFTALSGHTNLTWMYDYLISNPLPHTPYTSPGIQKNGCPLTVVVVDPRPPSSAVNHSIWYALESVASYVSSACIVIHTASCQVFKGVTVLRPNHRRTRKKFTQWHHSSTSKHCHYSDA